MREGAAASTASSPPEIPGADDFARLQSHAEAFTRSVAEVRDQIAALRVTAGSAATGGHETPCTAAEEVRAEVSGAGVLTGLWIAPSALSLPPRRLATLICAAANTAAEAAAVRRLELLEQLGVAAG